MNVSPFTFAPTPCSDLIKPFISYEHCASRGEESQLLARSMQSSWGGGWVGGEVREGGRSRVAHTVLDTSHTVHLSAPLNSPHPSCPRTFVQPVSSAKRALPFLLNPSTLLDTGLRFNSDTSLTPKLALGPSQGLSQLAVAANKPF